MISKREYDAIRYKNNPQYAKDKATEWRKTEKCKQYKRNLAKEMREKYPKRVLARNTVYRAVRSGKLPPQSETVCHICGEQGENYHHYKGYEREHWLDVLPICRKCHNKTENPFVVNR